MAVMDGSGIRLEYKFTETRSNASISNSTSIDEEVTRLDQEALNGKI